MCMWLRYDGCLMRGMPHNVDSRRSVTSRAHESLSLQSTAACACMVESSQRADVTVVYATRPRVYISGAVVVSSAGMECRCQGRVTVKRLGCQRGVAAAAHTGFDCSCWREALRPAAAAASQCDRSKRTGRTGKSESMAVAASGWRCNATGSTSSTNLHVRIRAQQRAQSRWRRSASSTCQSMRSRPRRRAHNHSSAIEGSRSIAGVRAGGPRRSACAFRWNLELVWHNWGR
jgi:hypothetical protein